MNDISLRDIFKIEDELLFHSEGFIPFRNILNLFGLAAEKVKPITVGQLLTAINLLNTKESN